MNERLLGFSKPITRRIGNMDSQSAINLRIIPTNKIEMSLINEWLSYKNYARQRMKKCIPINGETVMIVQLWNDEDYYIK